MNSLKLKEIRKEKGFTQTELAKKLNITQQAVASWENGKSSPDPITLTKIADILGVRLDELMGRPIVIKVSESKAAYGHNPIPDDPAFAEVRKAWEEIPEIRNILESISKDYLSKFKDNKK